MESNSSDVNKPALQTHSENRWIAQTAVYAREALTGAEGGHDWHHTERVWRLARQIAETEPCDRFVVELAALLHDIADHKFHGGDETAGAKKASEFLLSIGLDEAEAAHVAAIVANVSFKGGHAAASFHTPELAVVQDADRLDAIGAIGIARTFNYGGHKGRALYDPAIPPGINLSPDEYKRSVSPTINHFYEKLLLLKERMNTATARQMAERRHRFMEEFLAEFFREWDEGGAAQAGSYQ
jgi:uncharacterized protein